MGKRELLIIVAFAAIGVVAYQLTAPPAPEGQGFSLARWFEGARRQMRGDSASASLTRTHSIALRPETRELRLAGSLRQLRIVGEARPDIAWEFSVESTGPDEATALSYAERTVVAEDVLGDLVALRVSYPREARQVASLVLRVPARLAVRLETAGATTVAGVAALHLEGASGDAAVSDVGRGLTGVHRSGELVVERAGQVGMTLQQSRARFTGVRGPLTLEVRGGECRVADPAGPLEATVSNTTLEVARPGGTVRVHGTGGRVTVDRPRADVRVDVRRAEVEAVVDAAVPLALLTTDETLRLVLDGEPGLAIDAAASDGGRITATDVQLTPATVDRETRLTHAFGLPPYAAVALRAVRGEIVIRRLK